jgi:hypothetical protein
MIFGFEIDPIGREATDSHLVHHRGYADHLPIRILRFDVDFPDISVIPLLHGESVGDDWGVSSWLGLSPSSVRKQLGPSVTREEEG